MQVSFTGARQSGVKWAMLVTYSNAPWIYIPWSRNHGILGFGILPSLLPGLKSHLLEPRLRSSGRERPKRHAIRLHLMTHNRRKNISPSGAIITLSVVCTSSFPAKLDEVKLTVSYIPRPFDIKGNCMFARQLARGRIMVARCQASS
jgi:hypothetical protein